MRTGEEDSQHVTKVGLALVRNRQLLLVRRREDPWLILPGGKPLPSETDEQTLLRECREELSCSLDRGSLRWLGDFTGELVDDPNRLVTVKLYSAALKGEPAPSSEIEELLWHPLDDTSDDLLAPTLSQQIIPRLAASIGSGR